MLGVYCLFSFFAGALFSYLIMRRRAYLAEMGEIRAMHELESIHSYVADVDNR